jgi:tRNA-dihydrouridine synthase C
MTSSPDSHNKRWAVDLSTAKIFLAPMEGVVDSVTREMVTSQGGVDVCVTEFVRVTNHLLPEKVFLKYCPELTSGCKTPSGTPVLVQLLGSDPQCLADNAMVAIEAGAIGIDLNFGCPAKTVNNHDGGASLLKKPTRLFDVVSAVRKTVPMEYSVSAKVRLGFDHKDYVTDIALACDEGRSSWLTVHARTKAEGYKPPAHWQYIRAMKDAVRIPVVANGEIWTAEDARRCREISGCEHLMVGRGLVANPGLANEIHFGSGKKPWSHWQPVFLKFIHDSLGAKHENFAVQRAKQLAKMMGQSYGEAAVLLENIKRLMTVHEIVQVVQYGWFPDGEVGPPALISSKKLQTSPVAVQAIL